MTWYLVKHRDNFTFTSRHWYLIAFMTTCHSLHHHTSIYKFCNGPALHADKYLMLYKSWEATPGINANLGRKSTEIDVMKHHAMKLYGGVEV
jgi:hypothetical protein